MHRLSRLQAMWKITQSNPQSFPRTYPYWPKRASTNFEGGLREKSNWLKTSGKSRIVSFFFFYFVFYTSVLQLLHNIPEFNTKGMLYRVQLSGTVLLSDVQGPVPSPSFNNENTHIQREKVTCSRPLANLWQTWGGA